MFFKKKPTPQSTPKVEAPAKNPANLTHEEAKAITDKLAATYRQENYDKILKQMEEEFEEYKKTFSYDLTRYGDFITISLTRKLNREKQKVVTVNLNKSPIILRKGSGVSPKGGRYYFVDRDYEMATQMKQNFSPDKFDPQLIHNYKSYYSTHRYYADDDNERYAREMYSYVFGYLKWEHYDMPSTSIDDVISVGGISINVPHGLGQKFHDDLLKEIERGYNRMINEE